jgi:hypothetical protein
LTEQGYTIEVVERHDRHSNHTHDLFGIIDLIGVRGSSVLAVQTTSAPNVAARLDKIRTSDRFIVVEETGWRLVVHGWRADGRLREVVVLPGRLPGWPEQMALPFGAFS